MYCVYIKVHDTRCTDLCVHFMTSCVKLYDLCFFESTANGIMCYYDVNNVIAYISERGVKYVKPILYWRQMGMLFNILFT